jgi:hypothetical protein
MKRIFLLTLLFMYNIAFSGTNPNLKIYYNGKLADINLYKIKVEAKMGNKFYSILNKKREIVLPDDVLLQDIDLFRFIVNKDTLLFTVGKIFEDLKNQRGRNKFDELYTLFNNLSEWEVHVDSFFHFYKNVLKTSVAPVLSERGPYRNYKVYALRTSTFKYYLVPPNKILKPR